MQISTHIVFFSIIEQIEQSGCVEGQNRPDTHDLNTNGLHGFIFKMRKNYNNRRVVPNIFNHIAYLLTEIIFLRTEASVFYLHLLQYLTYGRFSANRSTVNTY